MEQLFYDYGYTFLIIAALIEGEVFLLVAGSLAYHGYFKLPTVMLFSFVGAIIHDQTLYWVGYFCGERILKRFPSMKKKSEKAMRLMKKHNTILILGFRFVYGIRTITPIIVGLSGVSQKRYAFLTLTAAAIWSIVISGLGYYFAEMVEVIQSKFESGQKILAIIILVLVVVGVIVYFLTKKRARKK